MGIDVLWWLKTHVKQAMWAFDTSEWSFKLREEPRLRIGVGLPQVKDTSLLGSCLTALSDPVGPPMFGGFRAKHPPFGFGGAHHSGTASPP